MIKNVAVLGSCVSRDNFNSQFNENYKLFFKIVADQHQTSFISITSKPVPFEEDESTLNMDKNNKALLVSECDKSYLEILKQQRPDYLFIDNYSDVYNGVMEVADGVFITDSPKFQKHKLFTKGLKRLRMDTNPDEYFSLWRRRIKIFFDFMKENLPDCKIVLIKARFSDELQNGESLNVVRKSMKFRTIDVDLLNSYWDVFDLHIQSKYDIKTIDLTDKKYLLSTDHPWGRYYCHYTKDFNQDIFNKFQAITIGDIYKDIEVLKEAHSKELSVREEEKVKLDTELRGMINEEKELFNQFKTASTLEMNKLKKRISSFENESWNRMIKRKLLTYSFVSKINNLIKQKKKPNK